MPSPTIENYLKQIYLAEHAPAPGPAPGPAPRPAPGSAPEAEPGMGSGSGPAPDGGAGEAALVPMGRLAAAVGVTPGTATTMVKMLAGTGLVEYEPRGGVRLTEEGNTLALGVLRRHRLIELFLVEVVGLDWSEVHEEAEHLEHAMSEKVIERIDALLGHPDTDPHGDPIPSSSGAPLRRRHLPNLADCPTDQPLRIERILDQGQAFLQFVDAHGLTPGADVTVEARHPSAQAVTVHPAGRSPVTLGTAAASKVLVSEGEG